MIPFRQNGNKGAPMFYKTMKVELAIFFASIAFVVISVMLING